MGPLYGFNAGLAHFLSKDRGVPAMVLRPGAPFQPEGVEPYATVAQAAAEHDVAPGDHLQGGHHSGLQVVLVGQVQSDLHGGGSGRVPGSRKNQHTLPIMPPSLNRPA